MREDQAAQQHLEECDECFAMLEALTTLDAGFEAMPEVDAPDELVESLLERLSADELDTSAAERPAWRSWAEAARRGAAQLFGPGRPRLKAAVAFTLLVAISPFFYLQVMSRSASELSAARMASHDVAAEARTNVYAGADHPGTPTPEETSAQELEQKLLALGYLGVTPEQLERLEQATVDEVTQETEWVELSEPNAAPAPTPARRPVLSDPVPLEPAPEKGRHAAIGGDLARGAKDDETRDQDKAVADDRPMWVGTETSITFRGGSPRIESDAKGPFDGDSAERQEIRDRLRERLRSLPRGKQDASAPAETEALNQPVEEGVELAADARDDYGVFFGSVDLSVTSETPAVDPVELAKMTRIPVKETGAGEATPDVDVASMRRQARLFLDERDATDVTSQPASGYWTNTYVPGDPVLRYLQARLAGGDRSQLMPSGSTGTDAPRLHDGARRTTQPFDSPADEALAIQLQGDRSAILGESRMLVQVGLAGTPRGGGRRPAMNVALVLDLRGDIPAETGAGLVALAGAFAEARDLGDRFRLFAAGRGGGELAAEAAGDSEGGEQHLRRGPAVVATRNLLAGDDAGAPEVGLVEAVRLAIEAVATGDDPTAPLGSSAVVVATTRPLGDDARALAGMAHRGAIAGIPLSVVGVGDDVELAELDQMALAGQGSRRLLREAAKARSLIDRELATTGRAVARAVRLRIDLAPDVRLIDVVGAYRLDEAGAEKVRQAEQALDQRLARNLGLEADRGDDETGIQIVIPTFYAGDHHVVLLDVVAPGPGAVADVTVRFKDLVRVENAVARARLEVARGEGVRGPLERNVLENLLAHRLRGVLDRAGGQVANGDREAAVWILAEHHRLLAGLRLELGGFDRDPDVGRDLAMLEEYVRVLGGRWLESPERRAYLADSLRYAAMLKVLPAPMPLGGAE